MMFPIVKEVQNDWVAGWKCATLLVDDDMKTLKFEPLSFSFTGSAYGIHEQAVCYHDSPECEGLDHDAPHRDGRCGFNAWEDRSVAVSYATRGMHKLSKKAKSRIRRGLPVWRFDNTTLLYVGLYGRVIEGSMNLTQDWDKWGYRASHQVVSDVFLHDTCQMCSRPADMLYAYRTIGRETLKDRNARNTVRTVCKRHVRRSYALLDFDALSASNDTKLHWGRPSE
jgi:hypothetical protein